VKGFGPETFGTLNADEYDALHDPGTTDDSVALIDELAGDGAILELAIGTGRVALPLARRGHSIKGVEASPDMVAKLRDKPGGQDIPVLIGDMAEAAPDGPFDFAFLIFNTLFNLTTQDAQLRCFQTVANVLNPGGAFLIETFVPDLTEPRYSGAVVTKHVSSGSATLEVLDHDRAAQTLNFQRVRITENGVRLIPLPMRYAWPAEIDLMAKLAGLDLEQRWGDWRRGAFTTGSKMHVSVYRKPQ